MASAQLYLNGARVTQEFRNALFDKANRAGVTPNEFCITAAAEKLMGMGVTLPGIFRRDDFEYRGVQPPSLTSLADIAVRLTEGRLE